MLSRLVFSCAVLLSSSALADAPRVATDIAPVHSLAATVMAGAGGADLVMRPGASPHGYAMRPSEAAALDAAEVVFHLGGGLTPWLDGPLEALAGEARVVTLIEVPGTIRHAFRETPVFAAGEGHDQGKGDDHDRHENGNGDHGHEDGHDHDRHGLDPHAWLDPENGKLWLGVIAETLAEADPENAALYRENAAAGQAEIDAAIDRIETLLAPVREARFLVFHDAYQYFERRFGLHVAGAISESAATAPGPARLAQLRDALAESGVACVFAEPQFDPGLIGAVLDEGGTGTAVLDPLGAGLDAGPGFYVALLTGLAEAIAQCP